MSVLCIFACLLAVALGQGAGQEYWQANFIQTAGATLNPNGGGQNAGVMRFNWVTRLFSVQFGSKWSETYAYNVNRGYNPQPSDPTAALQTRSSVGAGCNPSCGVARITSAMPPLAPSLGSQYMTTTAGSPCTRYTPTGGPAPGGSTQMVAYFTASGTGASTKICEVVFKDGRVFTIDQASFQWINVAIPKPTACTCDQKMDIWILVDHSSSINDPEMVAFKTFVQQFLNQLTISPTGINVGMSWFHYNTGINFNITGSLSNINAAMQKWWTNCSTAASSQYCIDNPKDSGCAGCQKSGTATATAIQGYTGPTTNPIWPGSMDVTGAMTSFYDTNYGGSARVVPKVFLTLTDGAMNTQRNQNGGILGCTFSGCTPDLRTAVTALRSTHNSKFPTMSLTTISMGIGATGTDPNLSLSPEHLLTLAENKPENTFMAPTFDNTLTNYLNNLLLLSCPATNDIVQDTCLQSCCGLCVCGQCTPPSSCFNNNNCTQQVLNLCCNEIPAPIAGVCPTPDRCTNAVCDPTLLDGEGDCVRTPVDCSSFTNGCTRYQCTPSTGQCTTANTSACPPVPCTWGPWSQWTACSVTCGTGSRTQTRSVNQTAANGGAACSGTGTQSETCVVSACCPTPCVLSSWTSWTTCASCGVGNQTRSRVVNTPPTCGGTACSTSLNETRFCPACINRDCLGTNSTGTCNCTSRLTTVTFRVTQQQSGNGAQCPFPDGTVWIVPCTTTQVNNCPVNCNELWTAWSACDCNYNTQNRSYQIFAFPRNGGRACAYSANRTEQQACTPLPQQNCPLYGPLCDTNTDCIDSFACTQDLCLLKPDGLKHCDWKTPVVCAPNFCLVANNTCDQTLGCVKTLKANACPQTPCNRSVCLESANGGNGGCVYTPVNCSGVAPVGCQTWSCHLTRGTCTQANRSACPPVDCQWSAWGAWSSCTKTCGNGTMTQTRTQNQTAMDGGVQCTGSNQNTTSCNPQCCPVDCGYSGWTQWSACELCATYNRNRTRTVTRNTTCGGIACNASSLFHEQQCPPCTPQNCTGVNTTGSCNCTADGLGGSTIFTFVVVNPQVGNGSACILPDGFNWTGPCTPAQIGQCPTPCIETFSPAGGNWSECDCYNFTQYKDYKIIKPPTNGGQACSFAANFTQWQACTPAQNCTDIGPPCYADADCNDELACTIDKCILFTPPGSYHCAWVGRVDCNSTNICQTGYCDQTVGCRRQNLTSDVACPVANLCQTSFCNVSGNGGNGSCEYASKNCSAFSDGCQDYLCDVATGDCSIPSRTRCPPIDCTYGAWGQWSSCGATCGNSTQTRTRGINRTAADGGLNCTGNTTDVQDCFAGCCPVDCVMTQWTPWSQANCTLCGTEKQTRNRTITVPAQCGGVACGNTTDDSLQCPPCAPVNCTGRNTTLPCNCSATGTAGTRVKIFIVDTAKVGTGLDCPFADATNWTEPCNATEINGCPMPCIEGYTNWSVCDCFNSSQGREYFISQQPRNGGTPCSYPANTTQNQTCTPSKDCPNYGPVCVNASDCNDGLACTVDRCIQFTPPGTFHCDWSVNLTCNDSSVCTEDRCDQLLGCVYTPRLFCEDNNNCTIDTCDPVLGCVNSNRTCPDYDVCNLGTCSPITGCEIVQRNCSSNTTAADNCTVVYCDVNYTRNGAIGPCATQNICATTAILAIGLGAGILAAIIILALLALALCSGGAYAAATNMHAINENAVQTNPLYTGAGYEADNPLFGGGEHV